MITEAITVTPEFEEAMELIENSHQHSFITGRAGTGKSTLLQHFKATTQKKIAVLAPTGVAALNVGGQTIHSFFKFRPDSTPETVGRTRIESANAKIYKELDALVIDEVSMLRADLLDCIDMFLRKHGPKPGSFFGGVQMLFFGDLYQLPPVVINSERALFASNYKGAHFFNAKVMQDIGLYMVELTTIYRQHEVEFIELLNAIRSNSATDRHLTLLNSRIDPHTPPNGVITLTTTNDLADTINQEHSDALPGKGFIWQGTSTGTFTEKEVPTPRSLELKLDAQVMLLTNDPRGRWVNGSIGTIKKIHTSTEAGIPLLEINLTTGTTVEISPFTWELFRYEFNEKSGGVEAQVAGSFTQFPLRLAWAVTIHKSQGKTFDQVVIDLGRGTFSPGQLYVALSRCRTLDGITLRQPVLPRHVMSNPELITFLSSFKDGYRKVGQGELSFEEWE